MGIQPDQFRFVLEGGETFFAPQVIMSYSSEGFDGAVSSVITDHDPGRISAAERASMQSARH